MKKTIDNSVENFQSFDILSENEMMQVRGGGDPIPPTTRDRDIFDDEEV